jgi:hypothetical protein
MAALRLVSAGGPDHTPLIWLIIQRKNSQQAGFRRSNPGVFRNGPIK